MEEKELSTTISASPVNSEADSPTPLSTSNPVLTQQLVNNHTNNNNVTNMGIVVTESLNFGAPTTSFSATSGSNSNINNTAKKKRGRPRKYDADGNLRVSYASPPSNQTTPFSLSSGGSDHQFSNTTSSSKRGRGRPAGSGNWQILASLGEYFANSAGGDFTPHVVTVSTGEDVAGKILSFAQKGPRGVCVLSANGAVSNVTIRQPGSSGGILTYEGRFEILSLSGSFTASDVSGGRSRTGCMSVSLAGPDGRVIGGGIAGLLTAASPIQIVVGSFMPNGYKVHKRKHQREAHTTPPVASPPPPPTSTPALTHDTVTAATPISQANPEINVTPTPPHSSLIATPNVAAPPPDRTLNTTTAAAITVEKENPTINGAALGSFAGWNGSELARPSLGYGHRSPDINVTVPGEY